MKIILMNLKVLNQITYFLLSNHYWNQNHFRQIYILFFSNTQRNYTLFKKFNQKAKQKLSSRLELVSSLGKSKVFIQFSKLPNTKQNMYTSLLGMLVCLSICYSTVCWSVCKIMVHFAFTFARAPVHYLTSPVQQADTLFKLVL